MHLTRFAWEVPLFLVLSILLQIITIPITATSNVMLLLFTLASPVLGSPGLQIDPQDLLTSRSCEPW